MLFGYAFTNPDVDNVYDFFPLHKPPPYAFINTYSVDKDQAHDFEEKWKEMTRFKQRQEGYLFTKLHKLVKPVEDKAATKAGMEAKGIHYDYVDVTQWTTADAHRRMTLRTEYERLVGELPGGGSRKVPLMYSIVVNDQSRAMS